MKDSEPSHFPHQKEENEARLVVVSKDVNLLNTLGEVARQNRVRWYIEPLVVMHPHVTCPHCGKEKLATTEEVVAFFVENAGHRSWSENIERFLKKYNVTKKETV